MKNIPERIFLHLGDPDDLGDCDDFNELGGVSWSDERINDNDVEYVRREQITPQKCNVCGTKEVITDGYCNVCGGKQ